ncbi:MAG: LacI family transcriptional regulator [Bacteroidales bacterium]|nr:LacI family transcriptional regulator [Bacteroidales bacterium]
MSPTHKPTIRDIANRLGINASTVSRALSGSSLVKDDTRELILEEARRCGYESNPIATSLRKGVSDTVGIVVPRINRQFFADVISNAETELNHAGYNVIICQTSERLQDEIRVLKTLVRSQVACIVISHSIEDPDSSHIREIVPDWVKLVQFDRVFEDLPGAKIVNDNFRASYNATRHLIDRGYSRIGTLAGYMSTDLYRERLRGYKQALVDAGRSVDDNLVFIDTIVRETGYEACKAAIEKGCDALYCAGDYSALGAMQAAKECGLVCPDDIGIVGTANESFDALINPSLTSLDSHSEILGRLAAQSFLDSVRTGEDPASTTVEMDLIVRESSSRIV